LPDEETAPRIGLKVLSVHGHITDEKYRSTRRIERERHQRPERKSGMLSGGRR
jgi:hypothetical protein